MNSIDDRLTELESALDDQQARIEAHEETIAAQQETIEAQRERLAAVENGGGVSMPMSRRGALAAGGALGLLGLGAGTASAAGSGQIGTSDTPVDTIYTEKLNGGLTNGSEIRDLVGFGLEIYESGSRLDVDWSAADELDKDGKVSPKQWLTVIEDSTMFLTPNDFVGIIIDTIRSTEAGSNPLTLNFGDETLNLNGLDGDVGVDDYDELLEITVNENTDDEKHYHVRLYEQ